MKAHSLRAIITIIFGLSVLYTSAAEFESTGTSTDWHNSSAWTVVAGSDADGIPDSGDSVTVLDGDTIIVAADAQCEYLELVSSGGATVFTTNASTTLNIIDQWYHIPSAANGITKVNINGLITVGAKYYVFSSFADYDIDINISSTGTLYISYTASSAFQFLVQSTGPSLTIDGAFYCAGNLYMLLYKQSQMLVKVTGELTVKKIFKSNPRGANGSMTMRLDGGTFDSDAGFVLEASHGALAGNNLVDMRFSGARLEISSYLSISGTGGTVASDALIPATVAYDGGTQTIQVDNKVTYNNIEITNSGTKTLEDNLTSTYLVGDITINSGSTFDNDGKQLQISSDLNLDGTFNASGTVEVGNDVIIGATGTLASQDSMTLNVEGDWSNSGTYTYGASDNIVFNGSAAQTISGNTIWNELTLDNGNGLSITSGTQRIEGVLDIDNGAFDANGQTVVLASSASGTAQMDDIGTGSYVGDLEVERLLQNSNQGWRELSSPVSGTQLLDWQSNGIIFSGFPGSSYPSFGWTNAYSYNDTLANGSSSNGWVEASHITDTTGPTTGWRVYLDATSHRLDVTGNPYQGDFTLNLNYQDDAGAADQEGWNLIGNPFACTIDWDAIDAGDMTNLDDAYWVWITDGVVTPQYGLYVGGDGTGTNGTTQYMPHSHAFWVHATANNPSITIRESDKNTTDQAFYKSTTTPPSLLKVSAYTSSALLCDEAILKVAPGADNGFVSGEDFPKLWTAPSLVEETTSLMFMAGGRELSYSVIDNSTQDIYLKSYVGSSFAGAVTLRFDNVENFNGNACVTLEDLYTGATQDLRQNPQYTYTRSVMAPAVRFVIHINNQYTSVEAVSATCHGGKDGSIIIDGITSGSYYVTWTDENGNPVGSAYDGTSDFEITGLSEGTYVVELSTGCTVPAMEVEVLSTPEVIADFSLASSTIDLAYGEQPVLSNTSTPANNYKWNMGDGTVYYEEVPMHDYSAAGNYQITLEAENKKGCRNTIQKDITVVNSAITSTVENDLTTDANVYTTEEEIVISTHFDQDMDARISVLTVDGKLIYDQQKTLGETTVRLPRQGADGLYLINIQLAGSTRLVYKVK